MEDRGRQPRNNERPRSWEVDGHPDHCFELRFQDRAPSALETAARAHPLPRFVRFRARARRGTSGMSTWTHATRTNTRACYAENRATSTSSAPW